MFGVRFIAAVRFEPRKAGYEAQTLPLCYAVLPFKDPRDIFSLWFKNSNILVKVTTLIFAI